MLRGDIYSSTVVPPSPSTKSLHTYYAKAGYHSSPIDILSPQDLTDARLAYTRDVYIYTCTCITRCTSKNNRRWLMENLSWQRLQIQNLINTHKVPYIKQYQQEIKSITPTFLTPRFLRISPSFFLSVSLHRMRELEFGPISEEKIYWFTATQGGTLPTQTQTPTNRQNRSTTLRRRMSTHRYWLTNWLTVHTPPPGCFFTPPRRTVCLAYITCS